MFAPTSVIFVTFLVLRKSTFRLVNVFFPASGGKLLRHPNMFGYVPNDASPRCHPVTGMPFWFRYLALASAERLFSTIPNTLFCSTAAAPR